MTAYDIVLVHALARMHNHYLNVLKHLGRRLRIAVYPAGATKVAKTAATERAFLELCASFGAEILEGGPHRARLLVVPQFRYEPEFVPSLVRELVRADRRVALQTFGYGNFFLEPLAEAGIERLYVYDRGIFERKLKTEADRRFVETHFETLEMGSPFARYPVFEDFRTDYMIAFPTELSFTRPKAKAAFFANVVRLLDEIGAGPSVTLKLHNVKDGGRLVERASRMFRAGETLRSVPLVGRACAPVVRGALAPPWPAAVELRLAYLADGFEYAAIAARAASLSAVTPYFNFGLELFLPGVRKGLITGRSSSVWHALASRLPVYNCDDETRIARTESVLDAFASYGVPPCGGHLRFDPAAFDRVSEGARRADLLDLLQKEL